MTPDTLAAKKELEEKGYTCVLRKGSDRCFSFEHGVKPLLGWVGEGKDFSGHGAADQVVGKAAALLYVCLGVRDLYARVISDLAARVFEENGVSFSYEEKVPCIINRTKDGLCPMEQTVLNVSDPEEAVTLLRNKAAQMAGSAKPAQMAGGRK